MGVRITSKGQITLPKRVRESMGLKAGDEIEFVAERGEFRLHKLAGANPFALYKGYLKHLANQDPDQIVTELRGD